MALRGRIFSDRRNSSKECTLSKLRCLPRPRYVRRNTMKGLLATTTISLMLGASPLAIAQVQTPPSPNAQVQTPPSPNAQVQTPSSPNAQAQTRANESAIPKAPVAG